MGILVVGSVAFDSVETPFGKMESVLGGSATYFSTSASFFTDVSLVAVVGDDFPQEHLDFLRSRNIDLGGLAHESGKTFHWKGKYGYDLNEAQTLETHLNVFENFKPVIPEEYQGTEYLFLANIGVKPGAEPTDHSLRHHEFLDFLQAGCAEKGHRACRHSHHQ